MVIVQRIPSNIRPMKKRCSCSLPRVLLSDSTETHPFNSLLCTSHKEVSGLAPTGTPGPTPASAQRPTAPKDHGPMAPQHTTPILTNLIPYTLLSPLVSSQSAPAFGRGVGTPLYSHASLCAYPRSGGEDAKNKKRGTRGSDFGSWSLPWAYWALGLGLVRLLGRAIKIYIAMIHD